MLANNLNAKNLIWHTRSKNTAGNSIQNHLELYNFSVIAPDFPIFFPGIHFHNPDVLDIILLKIQNSFYDIQNINELSLDHDPILLDIFSRSNRIVLFRNNKYLTDWKRYVVHLHETIPDPNPPI